MCLFGRVGLQVRLVYLFYTDFVLSQGLVARADEGSADLYILVAFKLEELSHLAELEIKEPLIVLVVQ